MPTPAQVKARISIVGTTATYYLDNIFASTTNIIADALARRLVDARPGEWAVLGLAALYHFLVLAAWYVLRPIRDAMGTAGGVDDLPWLFTATLLVMLAAQPLYAAVVAHWPRPVSVPWTYRFFALHLLVFWLLLESAPGASQLWLGRAFFVWASVFNLFAVSVFWGFLADLFRPEQGKRLFGFKKGQTDYRISLVPMGGYVKMLGEGMFEKDRPLAPDDLMAKTRHRRHRSGALVCARETRFPGRSGPPRITNATSPC